MAESNVTRIVAAVVNTTEMILYKEDGSTISILQGDPRMKPILDVAIPNINTKGYADIDLSVANHWNDYEKKSNGLVRFFRVAKEKISSLFGATPVGVQPTETVSAGVIPTQKVIQDQKAVDEIIKNSVPSSNPKFSSSPLHTERDAVVAVVQDAEGKNTVIPDVKALSRQVERAARVPGSEEGMNNFMTRIAETIKKRRHSIEELMRFMERGDLPVADDGSIIIYKVLRKRDGYYVDCHTQKVPQKIGSLVRMDESLVDFNRGTECSNGLHVARRSYISGFNGDVCVLAKVRPEDVITVPNYDANKMRVCAYHILFEISEKGYSNLRYNKPLDADSSDALLLARAIKGDHPPFHEIVEIGGHLGTKVKVTPVNAEVSSGSKVPLEPVAPLDISGNPEAPGLNAPAVDPTKIHSINEEMKKTNVTVTASDAGSSPADATPAGGGRLAVTETQASSQPTTESSSASKPKTQAQRAKELHEAFLNLATDASAQPNDVMASAKALLEFKKQSKKSWKTLGFDEDLTETLTKASTNS